MKEFEIKFYREWYDALSEMNREERAEAVLSLLEYAYENKIPDDKFIRIVTVLMRNKIDREKSRHNNHVSQPTSDPVAEKSSETSEISQNIESSANSNNSNNPENSEGSDKSQDNNLQSEIEDIINDHFSCNCNSFVQFCQNIKVDMRSAEECARKFIREWIKENPDIPIPIPERKQGMQINPVDKFIQENANPISQ